LSPSLESALGWNPDVWVGNRFEDFTHPNEVALAQPRRAEINTGATRITRLRLRHHGGTYHWVAIHAAPFTDAQEVESAVRRADRAMYRGKAAGGNRVELATDDPNIG
jgi:PAS domain-containing protein